MATDTTLASVEHAKKSEAGIQTDSTSTGKNLIVCIDGTSNQFGRSNTNVVKLCDAVDLELPGKKQLVHYSSGIGTRMKEAVSDTMDMAVAWSVDENIKEAYGWLAEKYEEGDVIFLFGFSRGAYQVRVLAGMIHEVGLIRTRTQRQVDRAYDHYEAIRTGTPEARYIARNFKKTFCWGDELRVHFIGVWDTVSSVGLSRGDVSLPMSSTARYIRHALALDECRVKFMPEYFRETSLNITDDPLNVRRAHSSDGGQDTSNIKEVWFAGSHADVGGVDRGKIHHAGNISLLWMHREAADCGLKLRPTGVTWGPDDIDVGTKNSMNAWWYIPEYIAMRQQVSYRGSRKEALRMHRSKPRLIMPHQKVHASILYANMYRPLATWARGFDISMMYGAPEDTELNEPFWETDLFSDMEAQELMNSLDQRRLDAPECLEKLLFMLRFNEGKKCVRSVSNWQDKFERIIDDRDHASHVRLVAIVAYYETSGGPNSQDPAQPRKQPSDRAFEDAKECLSNIWAERGHRYRLTTVALLNSMTRHEDLRRDILTQDVLDIFVNLVDLTIATTAKGSVLTPGQPEKDYIQVIMGLNALLQCQATRGFIIKKLRAKPKKSEVERLCQVLEVNNPHFLVAALRMILTIARIQDKAARAACSSVESRIRELMKKHDGIIGPLAVEIWLTLYGSDEKQRLSLLDARVRTNLASTLVRTNFDVRSLVGAESSGADPMFPRVLGLNARSLDEQHKKLLQGFTKAATSRKGDPRVRTTLTMTLLKLCEIPAIHTYLCEIDLVGMFVDQLQGKKTALLAAYALATCLKHPDMKESIEKNAFFPQHIVGMLQQDYFDDAIGQVEGLTIFVYLMQRSDLCKRIMDHKIMEVLGSKAGKGQLKSILSGLLYMDTTDPSSRCTEELVTRSLDLLRDPHWKTQRTGKTILTALAEMPDGAEIVKDRIPADIQIDGYQAIQNFASSQSFASVSDSGLSHMRSHLGDLFRELDIHIDDTTCDFLKQDRLAEAEASLTAATTTSHDTGHHVLACRAIVRARLQQWNAAIFDAEKSISIRPSFIGYIAQSIALTGRGEKHNVYRAYDLASQHLPSMRVRFSLLMKAIIVFMAGEPEDAVSRVDDLIATEPFDSAYCTMVKAYMYLLIGNSHMGGSDYEGAIKSLECARVHLRNCGEDTLMFITVVFGWNFDCLGITIQQRFCEALFAAGRVREAGESLMEMINAFDKEIYTKKVLTGWVSGSTHQYLSASHWGDNTVSGSDRFEEALAYRDVTLDSAIPTMLLKGWAKSTLVSRSWKDALLSSSSFTVPRSSIYRAVCEYLETIDCIIEASECFCQMANELAEEIHGQDEETRWVLDFTQRCSGKLINLGDAATSAERNDDAIARYSAALALNPATQQAVLIKRSKAYLGSGKWKEALDDAEKVILLDPSSPEGYDKKHAALHEAGDYEKAIQAFKVMLSRMSQSPDIEIRERRGNYVTPVQTMEEIRKIVQDTIKHSPRVLINTLTGGLCNKSEQAAAFEALPVFTKLISSMTTEIDRPRIEHAVKDYYRYATFSHKWEENEPLFDKVIHVVVYDLEESLTHHKLQMFCKIVRDAGFNWAWSDTCCIDKTDHFVLQEAIVAMFKWYEGSALTVIFLRGVRSPSQRGDLVKSIWNTRAWTFQEYHASNVVRFYTEDWKPYRNLDVLNHKECREIISEMEEATGVSTQELRPGLYDIRTKLCLASQRNTTLIEDAAYSLLGIFSMSLPVVYGEGDKALGRLLAQLLPSSGDTSILAWTGKSGSFNSCLPADISVFGTLPTNHIPLVTDDAEMDKTVAGLNSTLVMKLYDRLVDLPVPSFVGQRMNLPCLAFKLGPVSGPRGSSLEQVFRAKTAALGIVEIQTNENLSGMDSLYLVHPWIDSLLDRQPVGSVMETVLEESEDTNDRYSAGGLTSSPVPSNIIPAPRPSRASRIAARFRLSLSGQSGEASSLRPPSSISQTDKLTQARRTIARLKRPFGALLFTPDPASVAAYKRIATQNLITVQVVEEITPTVLNKLIDSVRILNAL